jgi:diadenosine tetraphosphate (Ap4A) HIT family hydrolase
MNKVTKKGVTYLSSTGEVVDCLFCRIQKKQEPATMVYEDEDFVVFKTIKPASHLHLLVTPRVHIQNVHSLKGQCGADLVRKLVEIGKIALGEYATDCQFSFHIPPLNSIDHLHLHAIASPSTMSFWGGQKYRQNSFFCQSADMVIAKLQEQERAATTTASPGGSSKL